MTHSTEAAPTTETTHIPAIPPPAFFFAMSLGLLAFFGVWSWLTLHGEAIPAFDSWLAHSIYEWAQSAPSNLTHAMIYITEIGGVSAMTLMAIMGAIWQTAIRHRHLAYAWFALILGCAILNSVTKYSFNRDRPPVDIRDRAVFESNKSFPSGHSMGSAVGYGMLAYALILPQRHRPRRIAALLLTGGMIVAVGCSRIYLRAHWFSDVVAGWTVGLCWLFFCIGWLEMQRRKRLAS